jgi:large subunit ribosomal protein L25
MADTLTLELEKREITGKAVKQLRRDGLVPAVIHDHGKASVIVAGNFMEVNHVYRQAGKHHPVTLKADGKTYTALIKDADFDPRTNFITHVVFNAVNANQKVEAEIPVRPKYDEGNESSPAERTGYIVLQQLETVEVEAIPSALPDELLYDAEKLVEIGDHVTVADLIVPKGVEVKTEGHQTMATVFEPSALAAANDAAGGDADADETNVAADHESGATEGTQADEIRPGGKKEFEDKTQGSDSEKK